MKQSYLKYSFLGSAGMAALMFVLFWLAAYDVIPSNMIVSNVLYFGWALFAFVFLVTLTVAIAYRKGSFNKGLLVAGALLNLGFLWIFISMKPLSPWLEDSETNKESVQSEENLGKKLEQLKQLYTQLEEAVNTAEFEGKVEEEILEKLSTAKKALERAKKTQANTDLENAVGTVEEAVEAVTKAVDELRASLKE